VVITTPETTLSAAADPACKIMVANGGGSIVNLSSIAGIIGSEHVHMAYNTSKAAVRLMIKSVAAQHAKDQTRAN
jgi:NAD(P)-dependent dehydrogenase (short-subunit alcohol dehydrogenase family)